MCRDVQADGLTIVPLKIYFKNNVAKLLVGLAKGRTKGDKREAIAKRESKREMDRAMSKRR
jgi:SsrA-binding protein